MRGEESCTPARNSLLYIQIRHDVGNCGIHWDQRKNRANQKKHHVSFETAVLVFDDPFHISAQDREVDGEERWQTIGLAGIQVLLVVHTVDEEASVIRIVSARKATRGERSIYAQGI